MKCFIVLAMTSLLLLLQSCSKEKKARIYLQNETKCVLSEVEAFFAKEDSVGNVMQTLKGFSLAAKQEAYLEVLPNTYSYIRYTCTCEEGKEERFEQRFATQNLATSAQMFNLSLNCSSQDIRNIKKGEWVDMSY